MFGEWAGGERSSRADPAPAGDHVRRLPLRLLLGGPGRRGFVEVKGWTLEGEDGVVRFPDAPTRFGGKAPGGAGPARQAGYEAAVCFVVQMEGVLRFEPNDRTHPAFGQALRAAAAAGVEVLALDCRVTPDRLELNRPVPVALWEGPPCAFLEKSAPRS